MNATSQRLWSTYAPFGVVALLGMVVLGWPVRDVDHAWAAAAGDGLLVALTAAGLVLFRLRLLTLLTAIPFAFLVVVALWRHADGGASSYLTPLVGLCVLWLGLHGTTRQVWAAVGGVAVVLGAPLFLVGAPDYPLDEWPRVVLHTAFAALLGPLTHLLVTGREEQVRRARALEPSDSRFRGLLEAAVGHAVLSTDLDGTVTVLNPGAETLLGWREAEVLGRLPVTELFVVREIGDRARELGVEVGFEALVAPVRAGGAETRDWTWITRDGERRTVSLTMSGVRDADDDLNGFIGIATDVTEQRATEDRLSSQQEVLRLVVEHLPKTVVGLLGRDLCWRTIAGQWLTDRGADPESFTGKVIGDRMQVADPEGLRTFVEHSFTRGGRQEFAIFADTWMEIETEPVLGAAGEELVLVVARDVTQRHETDAERTDMLSALRASEEGFRTAFESAPVGIVLTTAGADNPEFLRVNDAFATLLGRTAAEIEGQPADAFALEDESDAVHEVGPGETEAYRTSYLHASGRSVWVSVRSALVMDDDGEPAYVLSHMRDITDRRASEQALLEALEQQREAAETLRELDAVRVDTMSTISHELRTPLTSIEGYLELVADEVPGPLNADQEQMLGVVRRNAARLRALVDDLLDLSRLDQQAPVGDEGVVDLAAVVQVVAETVRPMTDGRGQVLSVDLDEGPHDVQGSADQLDRAVMNLVANAAKYTPEGGRIDVVVRREGGGPGPSDGVRVEVRDTGIGIPAEEQKRLFDRFFRASTAQRQGIEGTGLGLAIVKSIVERHHGELTVDSEPGRGSTFVVRLAVPSPSARTARTESRG